MYKQVEVKGITMELQGKLVEVKVGTELVVDWDGRQDVVVTGFCEFQDEDENYQGILIDVTNSAGYSNCISFSDIYSLNDKSLSNKVEALGYELEDLKLFLVRLRDTGKTNMYGAVPYMLVEYPNLPQDLATEVLLNWMKSFQ